MLFMQKIFALATGCFILIACNNTKSSDAATAASTDTTTAEKKPPPQSEFADPKYTAIAKQGLSQLASGDIDGWMGSFADNAMWRYSAGDSLSGKTAIAKYWKERRGKVIDSVSFTNDIWLPLNVNQPQKGPDLKGI
jgi:hypothetical protein